MIFSSREYLLFFLAVFALYWVIPRNSLRVWLLLLASFVFYSAWNHWLAVLIVVTSGADFLLAKKIDATVLPGRRKTLMLLSVGMNLSLLFYFKYVNFFLESLQQTLQHLGLEVYFRTLKIILPIGISFYTFEAINYIVDVYRGKIRAERNLGHFLLFILFFPHLIAGPIVRARDFLPQIAKPKLWSWSRFSYGIGLFVLGLFQKLAIADRMAQLADPVFHDPAAFNTAANWAGLFAFTIQVFCDFSGYTHMALGSAHLLGYKLAPNFAMPFLAPNISEFWRRWHMSLSSWLRDYVFIPLGGSRGSEWFVARNLILTMTIGGLWHGATWNYVLWGTLMGSILAGHRLLRRQLERYTTLSYFLATSGYFVCVIITFLTFAMSLVVFRNESIANVSVMFQKMFSESAGLPQPLPVLNWLPIISYLVIGHTLGVVITRNRFGLRRLWNKLSPVTIGCILASLLMIALVTTPGASKAFVYFQF